MDVVAGRVSVAPSTSETANSNISTKMIVRSRSGSSAVAGTYRGSPEKSANKTLWNVLEATGERV